MAARNTEIQSARVFDSKQVLLPDLSYNSFTYPGDQEALAALPVANAKTALELMEHLAILKRWYYRSSRIGELFFADDKGALPLRRIVRGIARVYRDEKSVPPPSAHAAGVTSAEPEAKPQP